VTRRIPCASAGTSGSGTEWTLAISGITVANGENVGLEINWPWGGSTAGPVVVYRKTNYSLRETGPGGGLVFYDKGSYSDGWRYLEAAPQSTEWTSKQWGSHGTAVGGTGTAIGTGKNNTDLIVAELNADPAESDRSAQLADALVHGGFDEGSYWSSSEDSTNNAWRQYFKLADFEGEQYTSAKFGGQYVRAVRSF